MRHLMRPIPAVLLLLLVSTATAQAQVFTPIFVSPRVTNDFGGAFSDGPGSFALEGIWRGGPYGLRVGYVDAAGGLLSLGGEYRSVIQVPDAPLGLLFTAGLQGLVGDENLVGVQSGLSAGYTFGTEEVLLTPYLHPRIAIANELDQTGRFRFHAMADIGADVEVQRLVIFRVGFSVTDIGANWGIGIAVPQ